MVGRHAPALLIRDPAAHGKPEDVRHQFRKVMGTQGLIKLSLTFMSRLCWLFISHWLQLLGATLILVTHWLISPRYPAHLQTCSPRPASVRAATLCPMLPKRRWCIIRWFVASTVCWGGMISDRSVNVVASKQYRLRESDSGKDE